MDEARSVGLGNDPGIGIRFDESERLGVKRLKTVSGTELTRGFYKRKFVAVLTFTGDETQY